MTNKQAVAAANALVDEFHKLIRGQPPGVVMLALANIVTSVIKTWEATPATPDEVLSAHIELIDKFLEEGRRQ